MKPIIKKVALVAHENLGARNIVSEIISKNQDLEFLLIITTGLYYKRSFIRSVLKLLREASFWFCLNRFLELVAYRLKGDTLLSRAKKLSLNVAFSEDINSQQSRELLRQFQPDVTLSIFTMHIFKDPTITIPRFGTIGCHPSMMPEYRGLEVFFWALANNEKSLGTSIFYLTEKVDDGKIILQENYSIDEKETVESLYLKLSDHCAALMVRVLSKVREKGNLEFSPVKQGGHYYPMPTKEAYRKFQKTGRKWK